MNTRSLWVALLLVPLAGCLGFGGEDEGDGHDHGDCPEVEGDHMDHGDMDADEPAGNGTEENATGLFVQTPVDLQMQANETGNMTQLNSTVDDDATEDHDHGDECPDPVVETPNHAPVAVLDILMEDGSPFGNHSFILPGQTLTFSGRGSEDHDGTIGLAGLTVMDTNGTRSVNLFQNGTMVDVILVFNHPGPVNVTLRVIDDRGDASSVQRMAYVNFQETGSASVEGYDPQGSGCDGPAPSSVPPLVQESFYAKEPFVVNAGAQWISVTTTSTRNVSICDPDGNSLGSGSNSATTEQAELAANTQYYLALHPSSANQTINYDVIVHFEPKPPA